MYIHLSREKQEKLNLLSEKTKKSPLFHVKKAIAQYIEVYERLGLSRQKKD